MSIVNFILSPLHLMVIKKRKYDALIREMLVLSELMQIVTRPAGSTKDTLTECIIFSMDRALQLHALLCSYFEKVLHPAPVRIFYRTSSPAYQKAYDEVFGIFKNHPVTVISQKSSESFKPQLIGILESIKAHTIFFLVDDDLFIEDVDMIDFTRSDTRSTVATLRMGKNLRWAYTVQRHQKLPAFIDHASREAHKLYWIWENEEYDWGYPLSVDGHLFSTEEILVLARHTDFYSPTTFESNLQLYAKHYRHRYGVCYTKSKILNIPINKVQRENQNIHGTVHQDSLLELWNRGMQMDYRALFGYINESAHQEVPIRFVKRV